jgi:ubiquinone biosynthesis O-methyltransferase
MNACRVDFIKRSLLNINDKTNVGLLSPLKGLKILDVGCGGGLLSESLSRLGAEVTGIDPSKENIYIASQHCLNDPKTCKIVYRQSTIGSFLFVQLYLRTF